MISAFLLALALQGSLDARYREYNCDAPMAQRAWIVFRDAHCTYEAYGGGRGGSMEPMLFEGCRAAITLDRIRQLTGDAERGQ